MSRSMSRKAKEQRRRRAQEHQEQAKSRRQARAEMADLQASMSAEDYERMLADVVGAPLTPVEEAGIAAGSIVRMLWRNSPVEDAHAGSGLARITDGEMFSANVVLTRLVGQLYDPAGGTNWQAVFDAVTAPDRVLAGDRTTADMAGGLYGEWCTYAARATDTLWAREDRYGARRAHLMLVLGGVFERWWGAPCWPDCVAEFARTHPGEFSAADLQLLTDAPDELSPAALGRAVDLGIGFADGFGVWRARRG